MISKVCSREEIVNSFRDGQSIAIGGQAEHGTPEHLVDCLIESGAKNLTLVSLDAGEPDMAMARLVRSGQVSHMITTHIGRNPEAVKLAEDGKIQVEFIPLGSFIERLRCGGMGLGGVLTKTGLGTEIEKTRQIVETGGEKYLLEPALRTDVALIHARRADPNGNLSYRGTTVTSNPVMAAAADLTLVETDFLMEYAELPIDNIKTPGIFVNKILEQEAEYGH